jgi:hypothetical protein
MRVAYSAKPAYLLSGKPSYHANARSYFERRLSVSMTGQSNRIIGSSDLGVSYNQQLHRSQESDHAPSQT